LDKIKRRNRQTNGEVYISNNESHILLKDHQKMLRPTLEDYAPIVDWMRSEGIHYVESSPFEANAQMKEALEEGSVDVVLTEDGD
jgi:hypothetical protein